MKVRSNTLFPEELYKSKAIMQQINKADEGIKESPYYIRQKIEIGILAQDHCAPWVKIFILIILIIYMYGAMSLKYVSGAESFV
jgi:hypothetical protein